MIRVTLSQGGDAVNVPSRIDSAGAKPGVLIQIRAHDVGTYRAIAANDAIESGQHDEPIANIDRLIKP